MLYQNGTCISQSECPCFSRGIEHPTGAKINEDCNTCTCKGGEWDCTKNNCDAVCKVKLLDKSIRFFLIMNSGLWGESRDYIRRNEL